jgi:hypothetical protein
MTWLETITGSAKIKIRISDYFSNKYFFSLYAFVILNLLAITGRSIASSMISLACYAVLILKLSYTSIRANKVHTSQREQVQLSLPAQSPINICCKYRTSVQLSYLGNNGSKKDLYI